MELERGSRELEKSKMSRNTPRRGVEDVKIDKIDENDVIEKVKNQEIDDFEEKESLRAPGPQGPSMKIILGPLVRDQ